MFFDAFPHTVTVQSVTTAKDSSGGTQETYATRQASVSCLITQQSGSVRPAFDQQHRVQSHTVTMTYMDTEPGDRLLVTSSEPSNVSNKYLRVVGITNHGSVGGIDQFCRLSCEQEL